MTGSHNYSASANTSNDENEVVIHDFGIANLFFQDFYSRYLESGGAPLANQAPAAHVVSPDDGTEVLTVGEDAKLTWTAADDYAVSSVDLSVSRDNGANYEAIATLPGDGGGTYTWHVTGPGTNTGAEPVYSALFRVQARDYAEQTGTDASDHTFAIYDANVAGVPPPEVITEFTLARIAPNPSFGRTLVEFTVAREAPVRLSVLDVQGREVAVLASGTHPRGRYQATWSGQTQRGDVPVGIYFVRYRIPGRSLVRRFVLAR